MRQRNAGNELGHELLLRRTSHSLHHLLAVARYLHGPVAARRGRAPMLTLLTTAPAASRGYCRFDIFTPWDDKPGE